MATRRRMFAHPTRARPLGVAGGNIGELAGRTSASGGKGWPHLRGDLDFLPAVGDALEALAAASHQIFTVTSGRRSISEQANVKSTYGPKAAATPSAPHVAGYSADVTVNGKPIWEVFSAKQLAAAGLGTFPGGASDDPVHVQLLGKGNTSEGGGAGGGAGAIAEALPGIPSVPGADDLAGAIIGQIVGAVGEVGVRVLLYLALTGGGVTLVFLGLHRISVAQGGPTLGEALQPGGPLASGGSSGAGPAKTTPKPKGAPSARPASRPTR